MNLILYKMTCEQIRVNKTSYLTQVTQLTGNLREPSDLINPSITIEYSGLPLANYAYISGFGRYYFITNITSIATNLWRLDMHEDVLMTFRGTKNDINSTGIYGLSAFIDRSEDSPFTNLTDTLYPMRANASRTRVNAAPTDNTKTWEGTAAFLNPNNTKLHYMMFFNGVAKSVAPAVDYPSTFVLGHILTDAPGLFKVMNDLNGQTSVSGKTPADYITSLKYYPYALQAVSNAIVTVIDFPGLWTDLALSAAASQANEKQFTFTWSATLTAPSSVNFFRNYAPYTNISVTFLPFGRFMLDPSLIFGDGESTATVYFTVVCDVLSGDAILYYGTSSSTANIYLGSSNIAIDCPMTSSSYSLAKVVGGLSSLVGGIAAAKSGDVLSAASGVIDFASAFDASGSSMTAGNSKIIDTVPHVDIITHNINGTAPALYGNPMASRAILGTLTGFTKVGTVHIENLASVATRDEQDEIEQLLTSGVIL